MPILKNNDCGNDNDAARSDRLLLMQTNIDLHSVTLGLSPLLVNWARTCNDGWVAVCANAAMENGQTDEAYQEYQKKFNECRDYYQDVKDVLMAIIHDLENPDEAEEAYCICGRTPRTRHKLFASIEQWGNQHAVFVGEADLRVVPDALVTNMAALWTVASTEKREASTAYRIKQELFAEDTDRLRVIYNIAKLIWHDDYENLRDLGFVLASEIWTPGQPEPGTPVHPEAATFEANYLGQDIVELVYGPVAGAVKGTIRRCKTGNMNWLIVAEGLSTDENRVPFRDTDVEPGEYEYEFVSYNNANEPSEAAYATATVPE